MDKRASLRQYYQNQATVDKADQQYQQRTAQLSDFENTVIEAFGALIRFMDGKTTKTEVVNQLKSISTPDVDKVVKAVSKLDKDVLANKLDLKPLVAELQQIKREMSLVPKTLPKFEQKDSVKVTNLDEVKLDTSKLEQAVKALKLDPKIDVKASDVQIDLSPVQNTLLDLLKAVKNQELPEYELPFEENNKPAKAKLRNGSQEVTQTNILIDEKFDEYQIMYDDLLDADNRVEAIKYFYKGKLVARINYNYDRGVFVGAKKVDV